MTTPLIHIVSLGAGDAGSITLSALETLRSADRIYATGEAALDILRKLPEGEGLVAKCTLMPLPMSADRSAAQAVYEELSNSLRMASEEGSRAVLVTIGDAGTYSGASYVTRLLESHSTALRVLPGVTYFAAAAAEAGLPLVEGSTSLLVLGGEVTTEQLRKALAERRTVVVMKLSRSEEAVRAFLRERPDTPFLYAEYLGQGERERLIREIDRLPEGPFPYFSLLILYHE